MSAKSIKHFILGLMLLAVAAMPLTVAAQDCPDGVTGDDCALLTAATQGAAGAESLEFDFDIDIEIGLGFFGVNINVNGGNGILLMDGAGNITAAQFDMPLVDLDLMFFGQAGAASFVLVDDVAYFGMGDSLDALTWRDLPLEQVDNPVFTFDQLSIYGGIGDAALTELAPMASAEWTVAPASTSRGDAATEFASVVENMNLTEVAQDSGAADLIGGLLDGMDGIANITTQIFIDPASGQFVELASFINVTMGGMMGDMGDMGDDEADPFADMFADLFGDMGATIETSIYFTGVNTGISVSAPTSEEAVTDIPSGMRDAAANGNVVAFMAEYFTDSLDDVMAGGADDLFGGMFGMDDDMGDMFGDFGFGGDMYTGHCSDRGEIEAGTIDFGQSLTGNLTAGQNDLWTFTGSAGQMVTIAQDSSEIDAYLELLGPAGQGIASNDDGGVGLNALIANFELPEDGTYTIVACSFWTSDEGEYQLTLSD